MGDGYTAQIEPDSWSRWDEPRHAGEHVISDCKNEFSRCKIKLKAGAQYRAGTVLASTWYVTGPAYPDYVNFGGFELGYIWEPPVVTATDGRQFARVVLYGDVDATDGIKAGIASYDNSVVRGKDLIWPAAFTTPQKNAGIASLRAYGIAVR